MAKTAKLFINARSQAVRLPAAYRFNGKEVFIRQDVDTGDVILWRRRATWDAFSAGAVLVTSDPAFNQVAGLSVADWAC